MSTKNIFEDDAAFENLMTKAGVQPGWVKPDWAINEESAFYLIAGEPTATWESAPFGFEHDLLPCALISRTDYFTEAGIEKSGLQIEIQVDGKWLDTELNAVSARRLAKSLNEAAEFIEKMSNF